MAQASRRTLLRTACAAATVAAARAAFPSGAHAQGAGPETTTALLAYVTLTDAAPLIVAKSKGLFAKHGMPDVGLVRQPSWSFTCESLALGGAGEGVDGAHIMSSLAYLLSLGKAADVSAAVTLHILARLNTNGQAISVSKALMPLGARLDSAPLKSAFAGKPDRAGVTFRGGTHDLWLRYWLAAGGVDPDKDLQTVVVPPPRMVSDMAASAMGVACVGEPWPDQIRRQGVGYTACQTGEIWRDHPEKALVVRADWAAKNPRAAVALTAAVIEAQQWAEKAENKAEVAAILGKSNWFNVPVADIVPRLSGNVDYGDGRKVQDSPVRMKFWADHASYPYQSHDLWFLTECMRWGFLPRATDTRAAVAAVNREDLWRAAAAAAGVSVSDMPVGTSRGKEIFFDGHVFDPEDPSAYLSGLTIKAVTA
ncbi:MAG TPA: CmpA/NrtA family ABC transporter substrate-binding protein [Acetobacteraceae bacterium]